MGAIFVTVRILVEISILWFVIYWSLIFLKNTRAFQLLKGIIILVICFFLFQIFKLDTLNWLLTKLFAISVIGILIVFQPELRRGLARIGQLQTFRLRLGEKELENLLRCISLAAVVMSRKRIGALIAIKRDTSLKVYEESGVVLDAVVSAELIQSIFMPANPLHDGGVIIEDNRISAAACLFPLSESPFLEKGLATRHRAGLGLSEVSDAIVIIVSEETGRISLAISGKFRQDVTQEELTEIVRDSLRVNKKGILSA